MTCQYPSWMCPVFLSRPRNILLLQGFREEFLLQQHLGSSNNLVGRRKSYSCQKSKAHGALNNVHSWYFNRCLALLFFERNTEFHHRPEWFPNVLDRIKFSAILIETLTSLISSTIDNRIFSSGKQRQDVHKDPTQLVTLEELHQCLDKLMCAGN